MISSSDFWKTEEKALLLDRNDGYLSLRSAKDTIDRASQWVDYVKSYSEKREVVEQLSPSSATTTSSSVLCDEATQRIFRLDAVRTFSSETYRLALERVLTRVHREIQDYHQGLGFCTAFLLLLLSEDEVEKIVLGLHRYYLPGYFKAAAFNYVRDAKVFEKILPSYSFLGKTIAHNVPAEAFCSKWFVGLNVHVLPFRALVSFFENLLCHGSEYLFKFGISVVRNTEADIAAAKNDVSKILAILRLDQKVYPDTTTSVDEPKQPGSFFMKIVDDALAISLDDVDIASLREEVEGEMREAEERRRKRDAELDEEDEDDEIVFSDEEE